ncbi:hypothetical protein [Streptococcus porcinus]|uniref:Uncharacterized protein n=1 Tax=Streptococcus porcinus TaxID=1340 RepID=A0A7V9WT31_STRPO|nr:hypothetical protein [Streptococcus porcinus]MBA2796572.1 hypothetical protein [Streptococcus porcinus]
MKNLAIENHALSFINRHQENLIKDLLKGNSEMVDELSEIRWDNLFLDIELKEYKKMFGEQKEITEYINSKKEWAGVK